MEGNDDDDDQEGEKHSDMYSVWPFNSSRG